MRSLPILLAGLVLATSGCGGAGGVARGAVDEPWGRTFLSVDVTEGGEVRPLVAGTRIRLAFSDDRRLGAHAGCNSMGGEAAVEDGRLVVGDLATTEMGCDPERHDQDEWLARFLTARPAWHLSGDELTLSDGTTRIRLADREVADPDRPRRGTRWLVDTIVDGDTASSVPPEVDAHLIFGEADAFGGSTGCNAMSGTAVEEAGSVLVFSDVVSTRRACDPDRMRVEAAVLTVLDGRVTYAIEADVLRLDHPDGRGLRLRAAG